MITNLFSIFDPATSTTYSFNWFSIFFLLIRLPALFWLVPRQTKQTLFLAKTYVFREFKPLIPKYPQSLLLIVSFFIIVGFNNLPGLLPYIFTGTSHIVFTISLALPIWAATIVHGWLFNTNNLLVHLIPNGTPFILMPFIVVIETIRSLIRPITLSIRLAANIVAGHLLISLLTSATPLTPLIAKPLIFTRQVALGSLEVAVAFIQAYVFRVLLTLYTIERIS